jgi:hypothetical protein
LPTTSTISPDVLVGDDFNNLECKAVVAVAAVDDNWAEGDHYSTIFHTITNSSTTGLAINLTDGSPLLAANVLVTIYDDDAAGIIIEETDSTTACAELDVEGKAIVAEEWRYEDKYFVRLTKEPADVVNLNVRSTAVATDRESVFTPPGRNFTKRKQVFVNGDESDVLVFNSSNWFIKQEVKVTAIDDDVEEGVDYLNFASQPSNLGLIQGPIAIFGGSAPYIRPGE